MYRTIIILISILVGFVQEAAAQSDAASIAYKKGIEAYNQKKYIEALPYLKQAASAGISEAYSPIIKLYADGDYDGSEIGNYKEALKWTLLAMDKYLNGTNSNRDLAVTAMMYYDPLCFLTGDYQETIDHGVYGYESGMPKIPYLLNQISASYLKLGKTDKAIEWLDKAKALAEEKNDNLSRYTADAIMAKVFLDKKEYAKAIEYSKDAASEGRVPLAAYVYGVCLIKTNNHPDIGKRWVKMAAEYDYNGIIEINCFEDEIGRYWRSIMNTSY